MAVEKHRLKRFLRRISTMGRGTLPTAALDGLPTTGNQPPFTKKELSKRLKAALPQRQKPTFEALEPRFLLSADLMPQVDTALLEGLDEFKAWTATLDEVAELNQALPLVDMTILDALDIPDLVQENLNNPLNDYFNSLNVGELATTDGVVSALANLTNASGDLVGNAFIFDVEFDVTSAANANLDLGQDATDLGLQLIDPAQVGVVGDVAIQFSFGVDVSDGVVDVTDFFIIGDDLSLGLQDDDSPAALPLRYNFVDGKVKDGELALDARVVVNLDELDSNNDDRISFNEINVSANAGKRAGELTGIIAGGDAILVLPLDVATLPFAVTGSPVVEIGTPDVFSSLEPSVSLNGDFGTVNTYNEDIRAALLEGFDGLADAMGEIAVTRSWCSTT